MENKKTTQPKTVTHDTPKEGVHYIDATNLIVGRMASLIAERLLKGQSITLVNTEKSVFTGNPVILTKLWQTRLDLRPRGNPELGPRFHKMPDRIVRKIIEGMLPAKQERGREALKRLRTYIGTPAPLTNQKFQSLGKEAQNTKTKGITSVLELSKALGYHAMDPPGIKE
jgi:large subunit ribosomal protein L13